MAGLGKTGPAGKRPPAFNSRNVDSFFTWAGDQKASGLSNF
jgi:hypothetical protein